MNDSHCVVTEVRTESDM